MSAGNVNSAEPAAAAAAEPAAAAAASAAASSAAIASFSLGDFTSTPASACVGDEQNATGDNGDDEAEEEEEEEEERYDSRWSVYSREADDEVDDIMGAATDWDDLFDRIGNAAHGEIGDTAVRERMVDAFEDRLKYQAEDGGRPFESYEEYCENYGKQKGPPKTDN